MDYRVANGLSVIPLSDGLTVTAGRHAVDSYENIFKAGLTLPAGANLHSWSDAPYFSDHSQAEVMWEAPQRLGTTYPGSGFEISASGYGSIEAALGGWQGSAGHDAVILNTGIWASQQWSSIGVGVEMHNDARYYHVWFGRETDPGGRPVVEGDASAETFEGTAANNVIYGFGGADTLDGAAGADRLLGGAGNDSLFGGNGADLLDGGAGSDRMSGGLGNDFYIVENTGDVVTGEIGYSQGGGIDTVRAYINYVQPTNIELVRLGDIDGTGNLRATGNDAPGTLVGNAGHNVLIGRGGNDQLNGNLGDDTITGNTGRDTLVGGAGSDTFIYTTYSDSRAGSVNRDVVNGFGRDAGDNDTIDLSLLDANTRTFGVDDAFDFIGFAQFSGQAGELRTQGLGGANAVLLEADHNGDGVADLQIFVNLQTSMQASDFIL